MNGAPFDRGVARMGFAGLALGSFGAVRVLFPGDGAFGLSSSGALAWLATLLGGGGLITWWYHTTGSPEFGEGVPGPIPVNESTPDGQAAVGEGLFWKPR